MPLHTAADALRSKAAELGQLIPVVWRVAPVNPTDPISCPIDPTWPEWRNGLWKNFQDNWAYAEVTLPETIAGVPVADSPVMLFINGWLPFTLWVDGIEAFKEDHTWKATGPIAQPLSFPVRPGQVIRLVACIRPTDAPLDQAFTVEFRCHGAVQLATQLSAAGEELKLADRLARTAAEKKKVIQAARRIDLEALKNQDYARVLDSIAACEKALAWLSPRAKALTIHVLGHTHLDMDWMWTWEDTVRCIRRDFKATVDLMDDYPEVTFTHSQVPTYQVAQEQDPDVFARIQQRIADGRWEVAAATWVEGDLNMADGESIARHFLYAKQWTQEHLHSQSKVVWEPDTFGHPGNMPQLAHLGECNTYFHMRCNPGGSQHWPVRTWEGIDGTQLTTLSLGYGSGLAPGNLAWSCAQGMAIGLKNTFHIWGLGDHGGGLQRWELELLPLFRDKPLVPTIRFSTTQNYLAAVGAEKPKLPLNKGEEPTLFPGCFTTHARTKLLNRQCETALLTAEALCARIGLDRRDALRHAWTDTLFNQFHDIFDGAAVHASDLLAHERFERSLASARTVITEALASLVAPAASGKTLAVVNPLGFDRTEIVRAPLPDGTACLIADDGKAVPVQKCGTEYLFLAHEVPAFATKTYRIAAKLPRGTKFADIPVHDTSHLPWWATEPVTFAADLKHAKVHVSKLTGAINGWFDKKLNREFVPRGIPIPLEHIHATRQDQALGVYQISDESPNAMNAWLIHNVLRQENLLKPTKVEMLERGPVFVRFRVEHAFRNSKIEQFITLYNEVARADFEATIDWREKGSAEAGVPQLKVSFGTGLAASTARFEGPFTVARRPTNGQELPTQKFVDIQGDGAGYTLYNDCKYGCDVRGAQARITLLRNTYHPDGESDNGVHTVRFAFAPHDGSRTNADCVRGGMAFNRPLLADLLHEPEFARGPVVIAPLFLAPGRHAGPQGDLARIAAHAREKAPDQRCHFAGLIGSHPLAIEALAGSLLASLAANAPR